MLPKYLEKYFWDTNIRRLDKEKYKFYIIERLLEMGDQKAIVWLMKAFDKKDMLDVLHDSKRISAKSRNFWNIMLST